MMKIRKWSVILAFLTAFSCVIPYPAWAVTNTVYANIGIAQRSDSICTYVVTEAHHDPTYGDQGSCRIAQTKGGEWGSIFINGRATVTSSGITIAGSLQFHAAQVIITPSNSTSPGQVVIQWKPNNTDWVLIGTYVPKVDDVFELHLP